MTINVGFVIVSSVKRIIHNKFVLAECRVRNNHFMERTVLAETGAYRNSSGIRRLKLSRDDVELLPEGKLTNVSNLEQGLKTLLSLYDNNIIADNKEILLYRYIWDAHWDEAKKFEQDYLTLEHDTGIFESINRR